MNKIKWYCYCYFVFIPVFLISVSSSAQDNFLFKVGLNKLFSSQYFIAGEYKPFRTLSVNVEMGFLKKAYYLESFLPDNGLGEMRPLKTKYSSNFPKRTKADIGYQINLEGRFRPKGELKEGLYLGVKTGYQFIDFGELEVGMYDGMINIPTYTKFLSARQQSWMIGATFGLNFELTKKLVADANIFSGYAYTELINPQELEFIPYSDPELNLFRNNHRIPIGRFRIELNIYVGF